MPLDPYNLTPTAGINRVKLMSAPGLPGTWQGQTAYQVMGRDSLVRHIGEAFPDLASQPDPVPDFIQQYLAQSHPAAVTIADDMGRALGYLLLMLKRAEPVNYVARPEWDESYWAHWSSIQHIIFGGGLMASLLGRHMLAQVSEMLDGLMSFSIANYPTALPLIGAARMITAAQDSSWIFDFGGTNIKRAHAVYTNGTLTKLEQLSSILIPVFVEADALFNFLVQAITSTISTQDPNETLFINASIANYVHDCQLAPDTPYSRLSSLGSNICQMVSEAVSLPMGNPIKTTFVHDGTAAAKAYAGAVDTAVITVGTALGIGFPPPQQSVRPLSIDFSISKMP